MSRRKKRRRAGRLLIIFFMILAAAAAFTIVSLDNKLFPSALQMADYQAKHRINQCVEAAVSQLVYEMELTSDDFYVSTETDGRLNFISVNTILINEFCGRLAALMSDELSAMEDIKIRIPVGAFTGVRAFANLGPSYSLNVMPMGTAEVDYSTSFESVGINQVNFQVWLNIASVVKVVNPLQSEEFTVSRKVSVVNTVISGEVPPTYLNIPDLK